MVLSIKQIRHRALKKAQAQAVAVAAPTVSTTEPAENQSDESIKDSDSSSDTM